MALAKTETARLLALVDDLHADKWWRRTECIGWTVCAMFAESCPAAPLAPASAPRPSSLDPEALLKH